jgi:hypothetical protein
MQNETLHKLSKYQSKLNYYKNSFMMNGGSMRFKLKKAIANAVPHGNVDISLYFKD